MRARVFGYMVILSGLALAAGCAKSDVVKPDESVVSTQESAAAKPVVSDDTAAKEAAARAAAAQEAAAREAAAKEAAARAAADRERAAAAEASRMVKTETASAAKEAAETSSVAKESQEAKKVGEELAKIYFDFDSQALTKESRDTLSANAEILKGKPGLKIRIEGNCDERGSDEYNLALGDRRAKSAMDYLITLGIGANRISTISYGKEKPADPGHDEAAWAKNRRDEFVIVK